MPHVIQVYTSLNYINSMSQNVEILKKILKWDNVYLCIYLH